MSPAPTVAQLTAHRAALMRELATVEEALRRAKATPASAEPDPRAKAPLDWRALAQHAKALAAKANRQ